MCVAAWALLQRRVLSSGLSLAGADTWRARLQIGMASIGFGLPSEKVMEDSALCGLASASGGLCSTATGPGSTAEQGGGAEA